ncbi:DUF4279 domain-containing protein [Acidovorax sp. ACV01]|uniref:DUF4279 domain-containing protein n=2 Tax=Acidovorax TaxID=12916 RepID=UPI00177C9F64|nr:DUF4279 domain-containing protein [Acidovorax sp. ACV01]MBD9393127.1 DUF4279 domain-containing protein [Acidovorax sp. ACV01]
MARISTSVRRRLERGMRRQENILRNPSYGGRPRLYRFDASLRIVGVGAHHDAISLRTGLLPARSIRKGERRVGQRLWTQDVWLLDSPLGGDASLDEHLEWLWNAIAPHRDYFREIISQSPSADIVLGCFSESPYPYLTVKNDPLHLLMELDFGVSFNFTCV